MAVKLSQEIKTSKRARIDENWQRLGSAEPPADIKEPIQQMRRNRTLIREMGANRRLSSLNKVAGGGDHVLALPRFFDPVESWEMSGIPWDIDNDEHREKLYKWLRLYYKTHPLIPMLIDIFTRFPLIGIELSSKDDKLTEFYDDLFMDRLDYSEFLVQLGREYWTVGEAFPFGTFNETLGAWEREELHFTEDVTIKHFPLLGTQQFEVKAAQYLQDLAKTKSPAREWNLLQRDYPEIIPYLLQGKNIPVSDKLMRQVAFKINDWDVHGTPLLLRGLRTLMHEEKLLASQDAIAERLYSPLILAKLGLQDVGEGVPWIPSQAELEDFRDDLDLALASDFRVLVQHFGVDMQNVFGREQMPNLGADFDRIDMKLMGLFGINPSLLQAGSNSQPYASSALQAEFLNQVLRTYQNYLKKHFKERALMVAEAQGHYDYEKRGDTRIPIYEERVVIDEEGNARVEKHKKLLIPDMNMKVLDLRDEATQRQFLAGLKQAGVPVSDTTMMIGMSTEFDEELEKMSEEIIKKTVAQQQQKEKTYKILEAQNAWIPPALLAEAQANGVAGAPVMPTAPTGLGMEPPMGGPPGIDPGIDVPGQGEQFLLPPEPGAVPGAPPAAEAIPGLAGGRPEISDQRTPMAPPPPMASVKNDMVEEMVDGEDAFVVKANIAQNKRKYKMVDEDRNTLDNPGEV